VAINVDPELLLVDEALAVGDTYFRHKCMRKVRELRSRGITIVFVSHSPADIMAIGDRVLWLEHGRMVEIGDAESVLARYLASMAAKSDTPAERRLLPEVKAVDPVTVIPNVDHRHGDGRGKIMGIAILNEYAEPVHLMIPDSRLLVRITVRAAQTIKMPLVGFVLRNHLGFDFAETKTALPSLVAGDLKTVDFLIELPEFYPGAFSFSPWLRDSDYDICDWIDNAVTIQMAKGDGPVFGYVQLPCRIELDPVRESRVA
jgi:lipopolysaccharide transport system ATP-binding protein